MIKIIFILVYSILGFSENYNGALIIKGDSVKLVGDQLDLELQMNFEKPINIEQINEVLEKTESKIAPFHIFEVQGSFPSFTFKAAYEKAFSSQDKEIILNFGEMKLLLTNPELLDSKALKLANKLHVYEPKVEGLFKEKNRWFYLIGLLFLPIVLYGFKKIFSKILNKRSEAKVRRKWIVRMKKAFSRDDFESIYLAKNEWLSHFPYHESQTFFKTLNEYQYKEDWTQSDMAEVTKSFEGLRDSHV